MSGDLGDIKALTSVLDHSDEFNEDFGDDKSRQKKTTNAPELKAQTSEPERRQETPVEQPQEAARKTPSALQSRVGAVIKRDQASDSTTSHRRHRQDSRDDARDHHHHRHNGDDDGGHEQDTDDHDDGYRRKRKLSSSLSSVVKVSERKYAVPRAMQPNKNILLNAVQAANNSVGVSASSSSSKAKSIADLKLEELRAKRKSLPSNEREDTSSAAVADNESTAPVSNKRMRTSYSTSVVASGSHHYDRDGGAADKRKAVIDENSDKHGGSESAKDSRKVQIETNETTSSALKVLDTNNKELQPAEPKFIVTLNGLEEEKLNHVNQQRSVMSSSSSNTSKVSGLFANRLGPVNDVNDDDMLDADVITAGEEMDLLDDEFGEHEEQMDNENVDEQVQKKKLTRCVFWPQCEKGDQCAYLHPNKPCTTFPNCPFGQQCHFLHPRCRYDGFCTRLDCPFVHMTKKPMPASMMPMAAKMNIAVPLGDDAGNEQSMDATASAPTSGKSITPKITINKIQPIYSLVNKPTSEPAATAESEEKGAGEPVAMATPATGQPFIKAPKYRHPAAGGGGAFYRGNHFSFVNRPTTSIPIVRSRHLVIHLLKPPIQFPLFSYF